MKYNYFQLSTGIVFRCFLDTYTFKESNLDDNDMEINIEKGDLVINTKKESPALGRSFVAVENINFLNSDIVVQWEQ